MEVMTMAKNKTKTKQPTDEQISERTYQGWLQPYLLQLDGMLTRRWDYWLRTLEVGKVLDEPIPQIEWLGHPNPEAMKNLEQCIQSCRNRFTREAFNMFVEWLLWGFGWGGVKEFPHQIEPHLNAAWYNTFNLGLLLKHPYDYLGQYIAEYSGNGSHNPTGYFPTPMNVCVLMTQMTFHDNKKGIAASVCDPCVGSGRFLMAASNYSLNLYGCDIDPNIINVCHANMCMYVPWALGRPEEILRVESPGEYVEQKDSLQARPVQQVTPEVQKQLLDYGDQMNLFGGGGNGK